MSGRKSSAKPFRYSAIPSHTPLGFQSIKKQGPPPWGIKKVGNLVISSAHFILLHLTTSAHSRFSNL
jgi:hypothetical protein